MRSVVSRHWHNRRVVVVVQSRQWELFVAARQSSIGLDCRADRRAARAAFAFEGGATAIAFDIHLEDRGVVHQAVDDGDGHCRIGKDFAPVAERLIGSDQQRAPLIAGADQLENTLVSAWSLVT